MAAAGSAGPRRRRESPRAERERIDAEIAAVIDAAHEFARSSPDPDPKDALEYLYASGLTARGGTADG